MNVAAIESLSKEELVSLVIKVNQQLEWYKKQIFGQKSEKRIFSNGNQLSLGELLTKQEEEPPPAKETIIYQRSKRKKGKLPGVVDEQGLSFDGTTPVKTIHIPNPEIEGLVEGKDYEIISQETSSTLAQKPASYLVLRYVQKIIKLKSNGKFTTDTVKPEGVFAGSYADVTLLANLLIDKCEYHLPLYRQHQRIQACGIKIARSSLTNFFHRASDLLQPIYMAQRLSIRESKIVVMDETPIKAGHKKGERKLNTGYLWGMYGDKDEVDFHYANSRASPVVSDVMGEDFSGILQTDGYEAYATYCSKYQDVVHAECWSHTRRAFIKAENTYPELVGVALEYIGKLYEVEEAVRKLEDLEKILKIRGDRSKLIVDQFFEWLKDTFKTHCLLPSDEFTKAANYALGREERLRVFLSTPELQVDTNHLERRIRPIAIGRKNWMFCSSEVGAKYVGIVYSLLATCKLHGVNPFHYLVDVLQRVSEVSNSDVALLTPRLWKDKFNDKRMGSALDLP